MLTSRKKIATKCDTTLPNGEFTSDCTGMINASCQYQCKTGSRRQTNISSIFCQHNGHWNHIVDKLCVIPKCNTRITNGQIDQPCLESTQENCSYSCNTGYTKNPSIKSITCNSNNVWSSRTEGLCKENRKVLPIASIAGGAGGCVVFILIIMITMFAICKRRKKKKESNAEMADICLVPDHRPFSRSTFSDIENIENNRDPIYDKPYDGPKAVSNINLDVDIPHTRCSNAFLESEYLHATPPRHTVMSQYGNPAFLDDKT